MSSPENPEASTSSLEPEILSPEPAPAETPAPAAASEESPLAKAQAEAASFKDRALRAQAELENYRKRAIREKEDAVKYANGSLLEKLIPILDNFELGLQAARQSADGGAIVAGFEMVSRQLNDFLTQHGVEPIVAEGQKFDPNLHEAFMQENSDTVEEGSVIRQLRKGFRLRERLLRPTAVVVSKGAA